MKFTACHHSLSGLDMNVDTFLVHYSLGHENFPGSISPTSGFLAMSLIYKPYEMPYFFFLAETIRALESFAGPAVFIG